MEKGKSRLLAKYLLYKTLYVSSCIKAENGRINYSKLSWMTGRSRRSVVRDITDLLMEGWCVKDKRGNIMFFSAERLSWKKGIRKKRKRKVCMDHTDLSLYFDGSTVGEIEDALYATAIDLKVRQCIFRGKKRHADAYKNQKEKRYIEYCFSRRVAKSSFPLSMQSIKKMLGKQNISCTLRRLERKGLLHIKRHSLEYWGSCPHDVKPDGGFFVHSGTLFRKKANEYMVNDSLYSGCPVRI